MEKRKITGYSVNEQLITGEKFYGEIGNILGIIKYGDDGYFSIIEANDKNYFMKKTVIDASVSITKNGPNITEVIYLGESNIPISEELADNINRSIEKYGNLDNMFDGEINAELALAQYDNSVFIANDDLIEKFRYLKEKSPEIPLCASIKIDTYDNSMNNTL